MYASGGTLQNRKGFTLIELLAVIVILAIIALIATPIVLNIISDSRESATLQSAEFYLGAVENAVAQKIMDEPTFRPKTCNIQSDGNLDCEGTKVEVEIKGEKPTSGQITLQTGKITGVTLVLSEKTIVKNNEGKLVYYTIPEPKSFATDSWKTIAANINSDVYKVGDTREIELDGFENEEIDENGNQIKTYTIRIANKTNTGDVCTKEYFEKEGGTKETYSKTACGFVIEFEDIILNSGDDAKMNLTKTNVGGWKNSKMRAYVNDTIYNALPKDLRDVIIDTTVVSGHGSTSDETNFVTEDKVYLLSAGEVWKQGTTNLLSYDTARENTRQLDYYKNYNNSDGSIGVTTNKYSGTIKKHNVSDSSWWLRSADLRGNDGFYRVNTNGDWYGNSASEALGVAVAFRIG